MAVRRDTIRKQFLDAVQPHLEPGEQLVAGGLCASGPSPLLLSGLFGYLGTTGLDWLLFALKKKIEPFAQVSDIMPVPPSVDSPK